MDTIKHVVLVIVLSLAALGSLPDMADAQYHGVTNHRMSRRASRMQRPGWSHGQQQQGVPEFDPNAAGSAFALLLGGLAVLVSSRTRASVLPA